MAQRGRSRRSAARNIVPGRSPLDVLESLEYSEEKPDREYHADEQEEKAVLPTYTIMKPGQFFIKPSPRSHVNPERRGGARARSKGAG